MTAGRAAPVVVAFALIGGLVAPIAAGGAPVGGGRGPLSADDGSGPAVAAQDGPRFVDAPYREHRGDVVRVRVAVSYGGAVTVRLRGNGTEYSATVSLHNGNGDGRATLLWNAYTAGADRRNGTFRAAAAGDAATVRSESVAVDLLPAGRYDLRVAAEPNATPSDRGTVDLAPAGPTDVTVLRARGRHFGNLTAPADVTALRRAGALARAPTTDVGDTRLLGLLRRELLILRVHAPGLAGALAAADGRNATARFGDLLGRELALRLEELAITVGKQENPDEFRFGDFAGRRVVADPGNDTYYLVVDPTAPVDVDRPRGEFVDEHDLDGYRVHLGVLPDGRLAVGTRANATAAFQFVRSSAAIEDLRRRPRDDAGPEVVVLGSAVLPVGEGVVVRVRDGAGELYAEREVSVGPDGTFEASFDLSTLSAGERFEVAVRANGSTMDRTAGRVGPWAVVRLHGGERWVQHVELVRVDSVATSAGGFVVVHRGSASGPVVGRSGYLPPGNHTDVEVTVEPSLDGNVTLVAVAHRDADGDRTYDPGADDRYPGADSSDGATLVDVDGTPTVAVPLSPTTVTTSRTPTPGGAVPGFGPPASVAALAAAVGALLARRRAGGDR